MKSKRTTTRDKMAYHDVQQVCLNGHQITANYNRDTERRKDFCDKCGEKTIQRCAKCNTPIRGAYHDPGVVSSFQTPVPEHCHNCGAAFPWTEKKQLQRPVPSPEPTEPFRYIEQICRRFHTVVRQLRSRHENRQTLEVTDEYDVQDLMHTLLRLFFDDIRPEEWTPSYAGKSSKMDFLLKNESIVIEVKKTRNGLGAKEIADQLIIDIRRYEEHPSCKALHCFIYDPENRIINPKGLENDLSRKENHLIVRVYVVPQ